MKDTLTKVLSSQQEDSINTASTINLEDDRGYFASYSSVDIHYEMLKVQGIYYYYFAFSLINQSVNLFSFMISN